MKEKKEKAMLVLDPAPDCCWACPMLGCESKDKFMRKNSNYIFERSFYYETNQRKS